MDSGDFKTEQEGMSKTCVPCLELRFCLIPTCTVVLTGFRRGLFGYYPSEGK